MTNCTDTNRAIHPGEWSWLSQIPGVDAVNQAIDDLRRRADDFIATVAKYDDLEVLNDDESPTGC
jgi:hypothetical protein